MLQYVKLMALCDFFLLFLQDFVEILMIMLHITQSTSCGEITADKLSKYAGLLADQGQFEIALQILPKIDQVLI